MFYKTKFEIDDTDSDNKFKLPDENISLVTNTLSKSLSCLDSKLLQNASKHIFFKDGKVFLRDPLGFDLEVLDYNYIHIRNLLRVAVLKVKGITKEYYYVSATSAQEVQDFWIMPNRDYILSAPDFEYIEAYKLLCITVCTSSKKYTEVHSFDPHINKFVMLWDLLIRLESPMYFSNDREPTTNYTLIVEDGKFILICDESDEFEIDYICTEDGDQIQIHLTQDTVAYIDTYCESFEQDYILRLREYAE